MSFRDKLNALRTALLRRLDFRNVLPAVFVALCVGCYSVGILFDAPSRLGYGTSAPIYTLFTYSFFHVSFLHLALNMALFLWFVKRLRPFSSDNRIFVFAFVGALLAAWISRGDRLVAGASGINYVLIGADYLFRFRSLYPQFRVWLTYTVSLAVSLLLGFLLPHLPGALHLAAFLCGVCWASAVVYNPFKKVMTWIRKMVRKK